MNAMSVPPAFAASALYDNLLQAALRGFFARATFETEAVPSASSLGRLAIEATRDPSVLAVRWFGSRHVVRVPVMRPFTPHEVRLAEAIGGVLSARYRAIFDPKLMAERGDLFRGAIEDRYVGAFLDPMRYDIEESESRADRIATAIEVLRVAALSSYENRPISSGALLLDSESDVRAPHRQAGRASGPRGTRLRAERFGEARGKPSAEAAETREPQGFLASADAHGYSQRLTAIKGFYRLCDGVDTLFLVNRQGMLLDIVDVHRWASEVSGSAPLPVPCADPYRSHARATLGSRHACVVLSPTHEIKVFAEGAQLFTFRHANWHLLDIAAKYRLWADAVGDEILAERLFQTALDLADLREGALFVVLREPQTSVAQLIAPGDRLDTALNATRPPSAPSRRDLLDLVVNRSVTDLDPSVLAALAKMDGATVTDRSGRLLAAGAILLHPPGPDADGWVSEGARTTAAMIAARFGPVLKVSEDGVITFYDGEKVWDI